MLTKDKIEYFREKLEEQKKHLEKDMERVGRKNPNVPGDWELAPMEINTDTSDPNDLADTFEELENRSAIEDKIEERLVAVNQALLRIKRGTFGYCQVCHESIEEKRLKVSPTAKTCIKHAK